MRGSPWAFARIEYSVATNRRNAQVGASFVRAGFGEGSFAVLAAETVAILLWPNAIDRTIRRAVWPLPVAHQPRGVRLIGARRIIFRIRDLSGVDIMISSGSLVAKLCGRSVNSQSSVSAAVDDPSVVL